MTFGSYAIKTNTNRQNVQVKEALLLFLNTCYRRGDEHSKASLNATLTQPLMCVVLREVCV